MTRAAVTNERRSGETRVALTPDAVKKLIAMGVKNVRDGGEYSLHMDDAMGYDVQLSGLDNNALTDG